MDFDSEISAEGRDSDHEMNEKIGDSDSNISKEGRNFE